jgi:hypothetical protein
MIHMSGLYDGDFIGFKIASDAELGLYTGSAEDLG